MAKWISPPTVTAWVLLEFLIWWAVVFYLIALARTWFVAFSASWSSFWSSFLTFSFFFSDPLEADFSNNLIQTFANDSKKPISDPTSKPFLTPNKKPSLRLRLEATLVPWKWKGKKTFGATYFWRYPQRINQNLVTFYLCTGSPVNADFFGLLTQ